jgi:DNA-binding response OmpR family regulator
MNPAVSIADRATCILVVDDEQDNRELLEIVLEWEGFRVLTAASGEEALATAAEQNLDMILLDVMMPGMSGYDVATKLRADFATKNVLIIMFTALTDSSSRKLGMSAGADDFLHKPLDRAELVLHVRKLLDARRAHPSA